MSGLDLDDMEADKFEHAATRNYGALVHGGSPSEREEAVNEQLDHDLVFVDCRNIDSAEDMVRDVLLEITDVTEEELDKRYSLGLMELRRAFEDASEEGVVLVEFDSMDSETQTNVAQMMKGFVEQGDPVIAYTCKESDAVTLAESDLRGRVQAFETD